MMSRIFISIFLLLNLVYCANHEVIKEKLPSNRVALVTASDYQTGFLSAFSLEDHENFINIVPTHLDALVRHQRSLSLIVNRLGRDNITILNPRSNYSILSEFSTGTRSNPYDIFLINDELAAVALFGKDHISVFNISSGREITQIRLNSLADADGIPEINSVLANDQFLYASVQRLDRNHRSWLSSDKAYLAKISLRDFQLKEFFQLPVGNPVSRLRYLKERNSILITAAGHYGLNYRLDGAVIEFDLASESFKSPLLREITIGYEIVDSVLVSNELGFIIGQNGSLENCLAAFSISKKNITKLILPFKQNNSFSGLEIDSQKRIYLGDRHYSRAGVRVFNSSTLTEITPSPIDTGLPPVSIAIIEE